MSRLCAHLILQKIRFARYTARREHISGDTIISTGDARFQSIANHTSISTSSTWSSDDFNISEHSYSMPSATLNPSTGNFGGGGTSTTFQRNNSSIANGDTAKDYLLEQDITARSPREDRTDQNLNPMLPQFCHHHGTEVKYPSTEYKMPRIHPF
jgi:hypothetical protein